MALCRTKARRWAASASPTWAMRLRNAASRARVSASACSASVPFVPFPAAAVSIAIAIAIAVAVAGRHSGQGSERVAQNAQATWLGPGLRLGCALRKSNPRGGSAVNHCHPRTSLSLFPRLFIQSCIALQHAVLTQEEKERGLLESCTYDCLQDGLGPTRAD